MHPVLTADTPLQWDVISELSVLRTKEHSHWLLDCFNIRKKNNIGHKNLNMFSR